MISAETRLLGNTMEHPPVTVVKDSSGEAYGKNMRIVAGMCTQLPKHERHFMYFQLVYALEKWKNTFCISKFLCLDSTDSARWTRISGTSAVFAG